MLKQVYEIGKNGYLKEIYLANVSSNGEILDKDKTHFISTDPPHGLYIIKWNGAEWVEGESEAELAEREAKQQLETLLPSPEEIEDAELEIKMITLLTELGVIV